MASISFAGSSSTTIVVNASHNGVGNVDGYRFFKDGVADGPLVSISPTPTIATFQKTFSGLSPNTSYTLTFHVYQGTTSVGNASGTWSTLPNPPSSAPTVTATKDNQYAPANISFSWNTVSGATSYDYSTNTGSSGNTTGTSFSIGLKPAGTYGITVTPRNSGGTGPSGTASITLIDPPRPSNFSWTFPKIAGQDVDVYATEWNSFTSRINEFRIYKNLSTYSFSSVISGEDITANIYNQAVTAINSMSPPISTPASATTLVTDISAFHYNQIRDALNSIT